MPAVSHANNHNHDSYQSAQNLLIIIEDMVNELHSEHPGEITLDTSLDKELGFDSLAKAELLLRVEDAFSISLSEQLLASMETPRDLLREIKSAETSTADKNRADFKFDQDINIAPRIVSKGMQLPASAKTLQDVLNWHQQKTPHQKHIYFYAENRALESLTYTQLKTKSEEIATGLISHGIEPGQTVALMLPTGLDYFITFFGILFARAVPVPIYPPTRANQIEDHLVRHSKILNNAQVRMLISVPEAKIVSQLLRSQVGSINGIKTVDELTGNSKTHSLIKGEASDISLIQYTSGSTGVPKGVALTHHNLLANVRAMGKANKVVATDVFVSWLPLYHDMGLIGAWFGSLYHGIPLVVMSPLQFLVRPSSWLWAIHKFKGTLSASPNFGYELCASKIREDGLKGLDLSSWRRAFNGAEPVSPQTIDHFSQRFSSYGFNPLAMAPVYGLAESSVGLAFPPAKRGPNIDLVEREEFMQTGHANPAKEDSSKPLPFVGAGMPLTKHEIRIVDNAGRELPERQEGRLEFKGPSATSGYFRNPSASEKLFDGDWLDSGDRAYIANGEVFITGRCKDVIIRAGRNLYPHELEDRIGQFDGVRRGCVAVFSVIDEDKQTEKLVIVAETREQNSAKRKELTNEITEACLDLLGTPVDEIILVPPHAIPKTSSGKIRHASCCDIYQENRFTKLQQTQWQQLLRISRLSIYPLIKRQWLGFTKLLYAGYSWLILSSLAILTWPLVAALPHTKSCWALVRVMCKLLAKLTGTRLVIQGDKTVRELASKKHSPCIFVANHASYLDGIFATIGIEEEFHFVAKSELKRNFFAHWFLKRLGSKFVDRFDAKQSLQDTEALKQLANNGESLFFFPEGTFVRMPGLQPFHMGAFLTAAELGIPIVPIALRGTRSKLRADSWFPRQGNVSIVIGKAIYPSGNDWSAAIALRDKAREAILLHCGEPDVVHQ